MLWWLHPWFKYLEKKKISLYMIYGWFITVEHISLLNSFYISFQQWQIFKLASSLNFRRVSKVCIFWNITKLFLVFHASFKFIVKLFETLYYFRYIRQYFSIKWLKLFSFAKRFILACCIESLSKGEYSTS